MHSLVLEECQRSILCWRPCKQQRTHEPQPHRQQRQLEYWAAAVSPEATQAAVCMARLIEWITCCLGGLNRQVLSKLTRSRQCRELTQQSLPRGIRIAAFSLHTNQACFKRVESNISHILLSNDIKSKCKTLPTSRSYQVSSHSNHRNQALYK